MAGAMEEFSKTVELIQGNKQTKLDRENSQPQTWRKKKTFLASFWDFLKNGR